jgi:hypothetical protein
MSTHSQAEKIMRELDFDFGAFTIEAFLRQVGQSRDRKVVSVPWDDMPVGMFGAWITDGEEPKEYIFYRSNLPTMHRVHIQLHEFSHFLLGHPTLRITRDLIARMAAGRAAPPFADLPKLRAREKPQIEAEAEMLTILIQQRVVQRASLARLAGSLPVEQRFAEFLKTMRLTC